MIADRGMVLVVASLQEQEGTWKKGRRARDVVALREALSEGMINEGGANTR